MDKKDPRPETEYRVGLAVVTNTAMFFVCLAIIVFALHYFSGDTIDSTGQSMEMVAFLEDP